MRRIVFAAAMTAATLPDAARAQVPGRDLLDFPIGALAEGSALATAIGDGFRNPATVALPPGLRARVSAAALSAPEVVGLAAQSAAASVALPNDLTASISVVRAELTGLLRTISDPQTAGEIPYLTYVLSGTLARRESDQLAGGVSLRYRTGTMDAERRGALGIDAGVVLNVLPTVDGRIGASSFLWTPGGVREHATWNLAADARLAGRDSIRAVRIGGSWSHTREHADERFTLLSARHRAVEVRGALGFISAFGEGDWRTRLGVLLRHGRYCAGVVREESGADLAPTYQFALTAVLQ